MFNFYLFRKNVQELIHEHPKSICKHHNIVQHLSSWQKAHALPILYPFLDIRTRELRYLAQGARNIHSILTADVYKSRVRRIRAQCAEEVNEPQRRQGVRVCLGGRTALQLSQPLVIAAGRKVDTRGDARGYGREGDRTRMDEVDNVVWRVARLDERLGGDVERDPVCLL